MKCKNCGTELTDESTFCSKCGTAVEKGPLPGNSKTTKKGKGKKIIIVIAIILIVGIISGVISTLSFNKNIKNAKEYISQENFTAAKKILDSELSSNAEKDDVYIVYSDYYIAKGEYSNAIAILKQGKDKVSDFSEINEKITDINKKYGSELKAEKDKAAAEAAAAKEKAEAEAKAKAEQQKKQEAEQKKKEQEEAKAQQQKAAQEKESFIAS